MKVSVSQGVLTKHKQESHVLTKAETNFSKYFLTTVFYTILEKGVSVDIYSLKTHPMNKSSLDLQWNLNTTNQFGYVSVSMFEEFD